MKTCKNIECGCEIIQKRTYCSLQCRNVYVNKYLRDYTNISKTLSDKFKVNYIPKKCCMCGANISYEKRNNFFCTSSCAASFNNSGRTDNEITKNKKSKSLIDWNKKQNRGLVGLRKCKNCNQSFEIKGSSGKIFCRTTCRINFNRKDLNEYQKFRLDTKFQFNVFDYPNEFDLYLILEFGMYKAKNRGDNPTGISRDHIFSIRDGFDNNIDPKLLSHPANCRLISQKENSIKHKKSIITIDELLKLINLWNIKYETNERSSTGCRQTPSRRSK